MTTTRIILATLLLGFAAIGANSSPQAAGAESPDRTALLKAAEGFVAAFGRGDAKAVAACWAKDGDYIDETGRIISGRDAIEKEFAQFFAANKGATARIEVGSLRFPRPDLAIENGSSSVLFGDGTPPSRSRYTNIHVKQDGTWLLASVREAPYVPPSNAEHLQPLAWTIGEWTDQNPEGHVGHIVFEWTDGDNFIVSRRAVRIKDVFLEQGTQRIGWDPIEKRIRSWNFETDGGFGEGAWTQDGNTWTIRSSMVLHSGGVLVSTNVVTRVDADTITWMSKDQQLNGKAIPDSAAATMKRVQ